jgi:hypothetical protein
MLNVDLDYSSITNSVLTKCNVRRNPQTAQNFLRSRMGPGGGNKTPDFKLDQRLKFQAPSNRESLPSARQMSSQRQSPREHMMQ